jgi:hypothetical protein
MRSGYLRTSLRDILDMVPLGPAQTGSPGSKVHQSSYGYANTRPATATGV